MGDDGPSEGDEGFPAGSASASGSNCWPVMMRPGIAYLRSRVFVASVAPDGLVHIPNALPDPRPGHHRFEWLIQECVKNG